MDQYFEFYNDSLGIHVQSGIQKILDEVWSSIHNQVILGVGFIQPYLKSFQHSDNYVMTSIIKDQLLFKWSNSLIQPSMIIEHDRWPFQDDTVDRIIVIHSLEFIADKSVFIDEMVRILKPQGQIIIVVPDKNGLWSHWDQTPFKSNFAPSLYEMKLLINQRNLSNIKMKKILLKPPFNQPTILNVMSKLEKLNEIAFSKIGGIIVCHAVKKIHNVIAPLQVTRSCRPLSIMNVPCKG